ncbi:hypothetical protein A3A74_08275 [Candidatus Roizmanbacteria bacterium RIFCSPLOWO2_01_FULL_35_13]|uniref:HMA domain-containing protein n=1 Tax=Candidatus Roizmanbacteria bacterium RIFCSPLOWO2_01_FULL_35_13 TaxID=1802055 RepID=A0A1F7I6R3_9BACT|nr:MAG: hypothetical protein A3A74_08275 [Candidatus Roizmanbacteria bacterium RIFCSPLOWO2_01_FULL_35_13]
MDKQTFHIEGMNCGACAYTIKKELLRLKGVKRALVHYDKQELKVEFDHKKVSEKELVDSVASFGYSLQRV